MTALLGGAAALFVPGYAYSFPIAPGDFDRLVWGYLLTPAALLGESDRLIRGLAVL